MCIKGGLFVRAVLFLLIYKTLKIFLVWKIYWRAMAVKLIRKPWRKWRSHVVMSQLHRLVRTANYETKICDNSVWCFTSAGRPGTIFFYKRHVVSKKKMRGRMSLEIHFPYTPSSFFLLSSKLASEDITSVPKLPQDLNLPSFVQWSVGLKAPNLYQISFCQRLRPRDP